MYVVVVMMLRFVTASYAKIRVMTNQPSQDLTVQGNRKSLTRVTCIREAPDYKLGVDTSLTFFNQNIIKAFVFHC
jgi:hypothetical protein